MSTYHNVEDKVICLNNAINILTRLLETIFKVVGADELMDGINIIVMQAQVPQLKLQLQMMDYYYEEIEAKQGVFESVKLRIRGIIAFIKNCRYSDFTKLSLSAWEEVMGNELSRHRSDSELSSDDQPEPVNRNVPDAHDETEPSVDLSIVSTTSQRTIRSLFGKKTKKIIEGKWMECLDPIPAYTTDMKTNEELVVSNVDRIDYRKYGRVSAIDIMIRGLRVRNRKKNCCRYCRIVCFRYRNIEMLFEQLRIYYFWLDDELFVVNDLLSMIVQFRGRRYSACYNLLLSVGKVLDELRVCLYLPVII